MAIVVDQAPAAPAPPELPDQSFLDRVDHHATYRQFDRLGHNLQTVRGVLGQTALKRPWTALMEATDIIAGAESELQAGGPPHFTTSTIRFHPDALQPAPQPTVPGQTRFEYFHELFTLVLSGIGDNKKYVSPFMSPESNGPDQPPLLVVRNMLYADIATFGRLGTQFFRVEFGAALGKSIEFFLQHTVEEILASPVMPWLRETATTSADIARLVERIEWHRDNIGVDSLLTSGAFSWVGGADRTEREAHSIPLDAQRPRGNRPTIEEGTNFYFRKPPRKRKGKGGQSEQRAGGIPVSGSTASQAARGVVQNRVDDTFVNPWQARDWVKLGEGLWDIATGLGIKEGFVTGARAVGALTVATTAALHEKSPLPLFA